MWLYVFGCLECVRVCVCVCTLNSVCLHVCVSTVQYQCIRAWVCTHIQYVWFHTVDTVVIWSESVCLCVRRSLSMCVCGLFFFFSIAVGSLSGLQVLKSMRFNTSSNLTLPDTALKPWKWDWKDTEALFSPQSRGFMSLGWGQLNFHWSVMPRSERQSCHLKRLTCIFFMTLKGQF